jgi:hypothetical protein
VGAGPDAARDGIDWEMLRLSLRALRAATQALESALGECRGVRPQALMPEPARSAHAAQRADPSHSPHFGG